MIRHKVQPGESLSKIAARYYGRSTAASVKEIYEANRNVMTSPDVLHAGVELVIPNARASTRLVEKRAEPRRTPPVRTAKPILQTRAVDFRWYQVKKQDRYYSIARRELGDASRWHEIFELNKDKFPDPGRIREGVRIKLPKSSSAARQGT